MHQLDTSTPERLSLPVLAALCDILSCEPGDLLLTGATSLGVRKTASGDRQALPANRDTLRSIRARITTPQE